MSKVGILVHSRYLAASAWETLVFGLPKEDKLGDQATLARVILTMSPSDELSCIVFGCGPSSKDGLSEVAGYAKKFLLDNFDRLTEFPTLQPLLARLGEEEKTAFRQKLEAIILTREIANTAEELAVAAEIFTKHHVEKVMQICTATHAARCIKEQTVLREKGLIEHSQLWHTIPTDVSYSGTKAEDVCVIEPLHRPDQPMTHFRPWLSEAIAPYFSLSDTEKQEFIRLVDDFMHERQQPNLVPHPARERNKA